MEMSASARKTTADAIRDVKSRADGDERIVTLADGRRARLQPVSASLIDEVTSRLKDPLPPKVFIEDKGREEENPSDPEYLRLLTDVARQRGVAAIDAMVMFGVELIDGLPEDDRWLKKLQYMAKKGLIDLSPYDLNDELDREFVYKRFVAVGNEVLTKVGEVSGVSSAEVARAEASFPSN